MRNKKKAPAAPVQSLAVAEPTPAPAYQAQAVAAPVAPVAPAAPTAAVA
jgi:hypothetical protein